MSPRCFAFILTASFIVAPLALKASAAYARASEGCVRAATPVPGRLLAQSAPGGIELDGEARTVRLLPACGGRHDPSLAQRVASATPRRRFLLVIKDLRPRAQSGVLFDLKLAAAKESRRGLHGQAGAMLGTLNLYAAQKPGIAARLHMVSYDVTDTLKALAAGRKHGKGVIDGLSRALLLDIRPTHEAGQVTGASIGLVALVEQ